MFRETDSSDSSHDKSRYASNERLLPGILIIITIVLAVVVVFAGARLRAPEPKAVQTYTNLAKDHTTSSISYPQNPPVGGPHDPVWQNCGIYEQPIRNENVVHSLEHGAVWLTYQPDLPSDAVKSLQDIVRTRRYILLSPYPDLPAPVVVTAWGVQLYLDSPKSGQLVDFITQYIQVTPTPEPGAPCVSGVGTPL